MNCIPPRSITGKNEFLINSAVVFEKESGTNVHDEKDQLIQTLYAQIGELKVANDFLKKCCCETPLRPPSVDRARAYKPECCKAVRTFRGESKWFLL